MPPLLWEIEPLYARGDKVMLYGPPGDMKSLTEVGQGLSLAAGRDWLGRFPITDPRKVLYIDEEMNARRGTRRTIRIAQGAGLDKDDLPFWLWSQVGFRVTDSEVDDLLRLFKQWKWTPDVVVIDSMRRTLAGNENSAEDVSRYWNTLQPLSRRDITTIVIHHPNKAGGYSGSTDLLGGPDVVIEHTRDKATNIVTWRFEKERDAEEPAFSFKVDFQEPRNEGPIGFTFEAKPMAVDEDDDKGKRSVGRRLMIDYLKGHPGEMVTAGTLDALLAEAEISVRWARKIRTSLETDGLIHAPKGGFWQWVG